MKYYYEILLEDLEEGVYTEQKTYSLEEYPENPSELCEVIEDMYKKLLENHEFVEISYEGYYPIEFVGSGVVKGSLKELMIRHCKVELTTKGL